MKRGTVTEKTVAVPFLERRQPMEDTAILELYWARDEQAIAETQKSYGKYCYSIAYHILHDREDTEECLNDTWMRAWNAIPPKKPNRLELFLGTITRNLSFDRWKAKNAQKRGNGIMDTTLDELAEWRALNKQTALIDTDTFVRELTKGRELTDGEYRIKVPEFNQFCNAKGVSARYARKHLYESGMLRSSTDNGKINYTCPVQATDTKKTERCVCIIPKN